MYKFYFSASRLCRALLGSCFPKARGCLGLSLLRELFLHNHEGFSLPCVPHMSVHEEEVGQVWTTDRDGNRGPAAAKDRQTPC